MRDRRDEEEEWTYTGKRRESIIDYVLRNEETRERIKKMKVKERVDSDHQSITAWMKGGRSRGRGRGKGGGKREKEKGVWTEDRRRKFDEYFGRKDEGWEGMKKLKEVKESGRDVGEGKGRRDEKKGEEWRIMGLGM